MTHLYELIAQNVTSWREEAAVEEEGDNAAGRQIQYDLVLTCSQMSALIPGAFPHPPLPAPLPLWMCGSQRSKCSNLGEENLVRPYSGYAH